MPTYTEIETAMRNALKSITVANGYLTDLKATDIKAIYDPKALGQKQDKDYPKVFLILDDGVSSELPSRVVEKKLSFIVVAVFRAIGSTDISADQKLKNFIEDVDLMVQNNYTLGGKAVDTVFSIFKTDCGNAFPEAIFIGHLQVVYRKQF